jgi:hypothetical protein
MEIANSLTYMKGEDNPGVMFRPGVDPALRVDALPAGR